MRFLATRQPGHIDQAIANQVSAGRQGRALPSSLRKAPVQRQIDKSGLDLYNSQLVIEFEQVLQSSNDTLLHLTNLHADRFSVQVLVTDTQDPNLHGNTFIAYKDNGEVIYGSGTDNLAALTAETAGQRGLMLKIEISKVTGDPHVVRGKLLHTLTHEYGVHADRMKNILLPLLQANSDQARTASIDAIRAEKTRPLGELSAPYHHWLYALGESTGYNRIRRSMEEHYFPQDRPMMEEFYKREVADIGGLRGSAGFEMMMASLESDQTRTAIAPMLNRLGMHQQAGLYDVPKAYIDQRETEERNRKAANIRIPQPKNPVW